jgi:hypothetical protein
LKVLGRAVHDINKINKIDKEVTFPLHKSTFKSGPKNFLYSNRQLQRLQRLLNLGSQTLKYMGNEIIPLKIALDE